MNEQMNLIDQPAELQPLNKVRVNFNLTGAKNHGANSMKEAFSPQIDAFMKATGAEWTKCLPMFDVALAMPAESVNSLRTQVFAAGPMVYDLCQQ